MAASRFAFRSHVLYDLDSVNFALGMTRFDPRTEQPHPPGYFLYVCLGRLVNALVHNPNLALVLISIAAGCGTIVALYRLGCEWFGPRAGVFAGLLFLFSPLAWFEGVVALTYSVEAFFSALLGFLCWRIECGRTRMIPVAAIVLGISAGIRPSSMLFLAPLFLFSIRRARIGAIFGGFACLAATVAAWFVPMIAASGGFAAYFGAFLFLWRLAPAQHTVFNSSAAYSIARAATILGIAVLIFGAALLLPIAPRNEAEAQPEDALRGQKKIFTLVWVTPALLFFTFIFLKFVNSGYLLLLAPAGCLWLSLPIARRFGDASLAKPRSLAILMAAAVNLWIFLAAPLSCSWHSIRRFEKNLAAIQRDLPQAATDRDTLIVGFDSHFLGFRHAGYYFPGYLTVEYPELDTRDGIRVFAMRRRATCLLPTLPIASYRRFLLFPLPEGHDYREYEHKILRKLPSRDLQTIRAGGRDFVTGPARDLVYLFPRAAAPEPGVYAVIHPPGAGCKQQSTPPGPSGP